MQVNILEAKTQLSSLIRAAREGQDVVIAHRGEPVVRLVPIDPSPAARGSGRNLARWLRETPLPAHLRRSHESIEADIEAQRNGWE